MAKHQIQIDEKHILYIDRHERPALGHPGTQSQSWWLAILGWSREKTDLV